MGEVQKIVYESWLEHAKLINTSETLSRYEELATANKQILKAKELVGQMEELEAIAYEDLLTRLEKAYDDLSYLSQYALYTGLSMRLQEVDIKLQVDIENNAVSKLNAINLKDIKVPNNGKLKSKIVNISDGNPCISEKVKKELTFTDFTSTIKEEKVSYIQGFASVIWGKTAKEEVGDEVGESLKEVPGLDQSQIEPEQIREMELATYMGSNISTKIETIKVIDVVQGILDLAGMIPVIGEPIDAINGCIYLVRGKYADAAFSFVGLIPIVGIAATGGRVIKNAAKGIKLFEGSQSALKLGKDVIKVVDETKTSQRIVSGLIEAEKFGAKADIGDVNTLMKDLEKGEMAYTGDYAQTNKILENIVGNHVKAPKLVDGSTVAISKYGPLNPKKSILNVKTSYAESSKILSDVEVQKMELKKAVGGGPFDFSKVEAPKVEPPQPKKKILDAYQGGLNSGLSQSQIDDIVNIPKGSRPEPSTYLSKEYINTHLAQFDEGASIIMTKEQYVNYVKGSDYIGIQSDGTQFVMQKNYCDDIAKIANGDVSVYEQSLGFDIGHFEDGGGLVRIDIENVDGLNLRMPSGNEAGANSHWIPGGKTDGGVSEAITDLIPNVTDNIKITEIK